MSHPGNSPGQGKTFPLPYSARFSSGYRRAAILALYTLIDEIQDIVLCSSTEEIRALKLAFWRTEIETLPEKGGRHPLTRALAKYYSTEIDYHQLLLTMIESATTEADHGAAFSPERFIELLSDQLGAPLRWSAKLLKGESNTNQAFAEAVGIGWALTQRLQYIGLTQRLRPSDLARLAALRPHNGKRLDTSKNPTEMAIDAAQDTAESYYQQAFALRPKGFRKAPRPHLLLAHLGHALLKELSNNRAELLRAQIFLPTARMHRIAFRSLFVSYYLAL